jgi:hypothetical protein
MWGRYQGALLFHTDPSAFQLLLLLALPLLLAPSLQLTGVPQGELP